jgi:5'-deoxynucleotidase YfbR-like HD superfamily hydrolase
LFIFLTLALIVNLPGKLKTLKRTGWVNNKVFEPESVADHMYRMSMLSFLIIDPKINKDKLMKVCMIHDLAESIVGDITPYDGVSVEDKKKMELDAMRVIVDSIACPSVSEEIMSLWLEYEVRVSGRINVRARNMFPSPRLRGKFYLNSNTNPYSNPNHRIKQR